MAEKSGTTKSGYSRRDFLKIFGAGASIAAAGCGKDLPEKFIPYVVQPDEVIPGVALWYAGTCRECSAGCGTLARVREGRVVKLEGNPEHPVNRGGLCAIGQSSLQALYDPDRVRNPLVREVNKSFESKSWTDAVTAAAEAFASVTPATPGLILTGVVSGSEAKLISEFVEKVPGLEHIQYELSGKDLVDVAAEQVFGTKLRTAFDLSKADVLVSFGADYLETWLSPVEFSRQWAERRKIESEHKLSKVVHFEPRLSLTAGNADHWVMNRPGSERALLVALLKAVFDATGGAKIPAGARAQVAAMLQGVEIKALVEGSGVSVELIEKLAAELTKAKTSLVLAGGAACSGADALDIAVLANLLNVTLGNVGQSVKLYSAAQPASSGFDRLVKVSEALNAKEKKLSVMMIAGTNPAFTLPAAAKFRDSLANVGTVIVCATALDETASMANIVLPLSHQLESWGDAEIPGGGYSLNQPAMAPLYGTQSFGDTVISIAANSKLNKPFEKVASFVDYMQAKWQDRVGEAGFSGKWLKFVELGGDLAKEASYQSLSELAPNALQVRTAAEKPADQLTLLVFPSVNSRDGSSANRPWMQELPSPITSSVWSSWIEMHPDLAAKQGLKTGDVAQLVTANGYIGAPVYVTKFISPGAVAVPIGQGHEGYGRFASGIGANGIQALALSAASAAVRFSSLKSVVTDVRPRPDSKETLVILQGSDSQLRRGIVRSVLASQLAVTADHDSHASAHGATHGTEHGATHGAASAAVGAHAATAAHGSEGHGESKHEGGHHDPLALGPRPLPKQMYRQMDHPLYRWGMSVDLSSCTGCSACVVACTAENNVPVVGKTICDEGREMSWIRIERYLDGPAHQPVEGYSPMMCQHCANAPCEPVCPVYATYHTDEGLNSMVYNRCVGTRYCLNNCSYKVRRFNWFKYTWAEPLNWQLNPDVTVREVGVMEKCSFCIQRIKEGTNKAKDLGRPVKDGEINPACASSCPTKAINFGNLLDPESVVAQHHESKRSYKVLDVELNTQPAIAYLARVKNHPVGV